MSLYAHSYEDLINDFVSEYKRIEQKVSQYFEFEHLLMSTLRRITDIQSKYCENTFISLHWQLDLWFKLWFTMSSLCCSLIHGSYSNRSRSTTKYIQLDKFGNFLNNPCCLEWISRNLNGEVILFLSVNI